MFLWIDFGVFGVVWDVILFGKEKILYNCLKLFFVCLILGFNLVYELFKYELDIIIWLLWFGFLI